MAPVYPQPQPCPSCGHCPTCGRGGYHTYPYSPYPYYPAQPWYTSVTRTVVPQSNGGTVTLNSGSGIQTYTSNAPAYKD